MQWAMRMMVGGALHQAGAAADLPAWCPCPSHCQFSLQAAHQLLPCRPAFLAACLQS